MPDRIHQVQVQRPDGTVETLEAVELGFTQIREDWNEYRMDNGIHVRIRTTPVKFFIAVDENGEPRNNVTGDPYIISRQNIQVISRHAEEE